MTADPPAEPSPRALGESLAALAVQVAALRGQIAQVKQRLDQELVWGKSCLHDPGEEPIHLDHPLTPNRAGHHMAAEREQNSWKL